MDIQFIQFNDSVPLTEIAEIPNMVPRSMLLHGKDLTSTVDVLINEDSSPSFVVADQRTIIAQVPSSSAGRLVTSVVAVSSDFTASLKSIITFKIGNEPKKVSGIKALMQMWLKILLTTPGYDSFTKNAGGGAQEYIGGQFSGGSAVSASFAIAVQQTTKQILSLQAKQTRIPDDERLIASELIGLSYDPSLPGLLARVALYTQAGARAIANMEL
jgi:hypothetical protein